MRTVLAPDLELSRYSLKAADKQARMPLASSAVALIIQKIGLSVDAIHFYERNALPPRATYGERDVETLAFIRRVQGGIQTKRNSEL